MYNCAWNGVCTIVCVPPCACSGGVQLCVYSAVFTQYTCNRMQHLVAFPTVKCRVILYVNLDTVSAKSAPCGYSVLCEHCSGTCEVVCVSYIMAPHQIQRQPCWSIHLHHRSSFAYIHVHSLFPLSQTDDLTLIISTLCTLFVIGCIPPEALAQPTFVLM